MTTTTRKDAVKANVTPPRKPPRIATGVAGGGNRRPPSSRRKPGGDDQDGPGLGWAAILEGLFWLFWIMVGLALDS